MHMQITGENVEITDLMTDLIETKLGKNIERHLRRFDESVQTAVVKIKKHDNQFYTVNFNMELPAKEHIFAENTNKNLSAAITGLKEEVGRQIEKYKSKLDRHDANPTSQSE